MFSIQHSRFYLIMTDRSVGVKGRGKTVSGVWWQVSGKGSGML